MADGLSNTAAFSERAKGTGVEGSLDRLSDLYNIPGAWTEDTFRDRCRGLTPRLASRARATSSGR